MARKMKMGQALIWLGGTLFVIYLNTFESGCGLLRAYGPWA